MSGRPRERFVSRQLLHWACACPARPESQVRAYYRALAQAWGAQHWWPAQSRFEVIVGAFLTQNTSWNNVERALANLRAARALSIKQIRRMPLAQLERLLRPAGYFRQKAQRLKTFVRFLDTRHGGSLDRMFAQSTAVLREELLALNGVGPETADSILLYAGNYSVFVVDAYTRRIAERHGLLAASAGYEEIRQLFERALQPALPVTALSLPAGTSRRADQPSRGTAHLPSRISTRKRAPRVQVLNEMHALMVGVGKNYCLRAAPHCDGCPLQPFLPGAAQPFRKFK